jgi:tetratricopeptide (TPR) repeat protein
MIRSALRFGGPDSAVVDSMGWVYYKRGRFGQAMLYVSRALRLHDEPDAEGLDHLGDIYYRLNEPDQAVGAWQRALTAAEDADSHDQQRLKRLQKKLKLVESDQRLPVAFSVVDVQPESPPPTDD